MVYRVRVRSMFGDYVVSAATEEEAIGAALKKHEERETNSAWEPEVDVIEEPDSTVEVEACPDDVTSYYALYRRGAEAVELRKTALPATVKHTYGWRGPKPKVPSRTKK